MNVFDNLSHNYTISPFLTFYVYLNLVVISTSIPCLTSLSYVPKAHKTQEFELNSCC